MIARGVIADRQITVEGDEAAVAQLAELISPTSELIGGEPDILVRAHWRRSGGGDRPDRPLAPWFFYGAVQCSEGPDGVRADDGSSFADISLGGARADIFVANDFSSERLEIRAVTLRMAFLLALRAQDVFELHAGAVEREGGAVLLVGPSGSGKSTLTTALADGGGRYLGDDTALLWREGGSGELRVGAMHRPFFLGDAAIAAFPRLARAATATTLHGEKWAVDPVGAWSAAPVAKSIPCALFFPTIVEGLATSRAMQMTHAEAFGELVGSSALLMVDEPSRRARHLALLTDLLRACGAHRLELGADLLATPVETARRLVDRCATNPSLSRRSP